MPAPDTDQPSSAAGVLDQESNARYHLAFAALAAADDLRALAGPAWADLVFAPTGGGVTATGT